MELIKNNHVYSFRRGIYASKNLPKDLYVRVRSTGKLLDAKIEIHKKNEAKISLATPETAVSPGQACVFYCKDEIGTRLLGGGWIHSTN